MKVGIFVIVFSLTTFSQITIYKYSPWPGNKDDQYLQVRENGTPVYRTSNNWEFTSNLITSLTNNLHFSIFDIRNETTRQLNLKVPPNLPSADSVALTFCYNNELNQGFYSYSKHWTTFICRFINEAVSLVDSFAFSPINKMAMTDRYLIYQLSFSNNEMVVQDLMKESKVVMDWVDSWHVYNDSTIFYLKEKVLHCYDLSNGTTTQIPGKYESIVFHPFSTDKNGFFFVSQDSTAHINYFNFKQNSIVNDTIKLKGYSFIYDLIFDPWHHTLDIYSTEYFINHIDEIVLPHFMKVNLNSNQVISTTDCFEIYRQIYIK